MSALVLHIKQFLQSLQAAAFTIMLTASVLLTASQSALTGRYSGPLIDAHAQVRCDASPDKIINLINQSDVELVLLSAGGCNKKEQFFVPRSQHFNNIAEIVKKTNHKAALMTGLKPLTQQNGAILDSNEISKFFDEDIVRGSVGFGEIVLQHAKWEDPRLVFEGLEIPLLSNRVQLYVNEIAKRKKPVIIHIELQDNLAKAQATLNDLSELLNKYPQHPFALIHMGQATPSQAAFLMSKHDNLDLIISMSDGLHQLMSNGTSTYQIGWTSVFSLEGVSLAQHLRDPVWKKEWFDLFSKYPHRFILATDPVFIGNWRKRRPYSIEIWRNALGDLEPKAARMIACENAARLWSLPFTCFRN